LILALLVLPSCEQTGQNIVGSNADTPIPNVTFQVDTTYLTTSPASMIAKGKARNTGSTTISSPWYIEGQFYTDATFQTKLGGNYTQIGVPLSNGQQILWMITFTTSAIDVRQYPNFRVGDLRAIYKN
jgi:hypothetical protein